MTKYKGVEIVRFSDGKAERLIPFDPPRSEHLADRVDAGLNRNLNHDLYYTRLVEVEEPGTEGPTPGTLAHREAEDG